MPGTLFVVATPIGNLEDVTLRALRVLRDATVVAAEDTRRTGLFLRHYDIRTPLVSFHDHNERGRVPELVARLQRGESVALVSDAGTPLVSDPGFRLVREAIAAGIAVVAVPGPSAVTAALSVAGIAVDGFTFAGFPPARAGERDRWFRDLAATPRTVVLFEAPHRVVATLEAALAALGNRWTVLARELTKLHETTRRGWLRDLLADGIEPRGEYVILLSDLNSNAREQGCRGAGAVNVSAGTDIGTEFCRMTKNGWLSARDAVAQLAATTGLSRQAVYRQLKKAGVLGQSTEP
jgi:16S rRNA (cytidine1402-2'-O)-methyltransferase